jgi:hypothetical protein
MDAILTALDNLDYDEALEVYTEGGNSKSYSKLTVSGGIPSDIADGDEITGVDDNGDAVVGEAYDDYSAGATEIGFLYHVGDTEMSTCRVGALDDPVTDGCLASTGDITVGGETIAYEASFNVNGRTLQGFSTGAEVKMYTCSIGCPYKTYSMFYDYYGDFDYADKWVLAAINKDKTKFSSGNGDADFKNYKTDEIRTQAIKKGIAYMNVWMYVIREFEDAIDDCTEGCISCNDGPVHAWDEGVAFYTGTLEGTDGSSSGVMVHALADKRCANYMTCGMDGDSTMGISQVNYKLLELFAQGQHYLTVGACSKVRGVLTMIEAQMAIPLIQGTMRYAYKVAYLGGGDEEMAEGAVFAAAILPVVNYCKQNRANKIYDSMQIGAASVNFEEVKESFETVYDCMNVTCAEVGGLWNNDDGAYYDGFEPCEFEPSFSSYSDCASPPPAPLCEDEKSSKKCSKIVKKGQCSKKKKMDQCLSSCGEC